MKHLVIAGTCAVTLCLLAACDKEKDYYDVLDAKTYTGFNELTVTYNESPMSGKASHSRLRPVLRPLSRSSLSLIFRSFPGR